MPDDAAAALAHGLLDQPEHVVRSTRARGWGWRVLRCVIASGLFAFIGTALLMHNLPARGLLRDVVLGANRRLDVNRWVRTWVGSQRWAMFAPDPYVANTYVGVLVEDRNGETWDLAHDHHGRRTYPYLVYDRMGKVNRRLIERGSYRRPYAAWVCREWARNHDGEPPVKVRFIHKWARLVPPERSYELGGFDPERLNMGQKEVDAFMCAGLEHGQLSPQLRQRYGFEPGGVVPFKDVTSRTWAKRRRVVLTPSGEKPEADPDEDEEGGGW